MCMTVHARGSGFDYSAFRASCTWRFLCVPKGGWEGGGGVRVGNLACFAVFRWLNF